MAINSKKIPKKEFQIFTSKSKINKRGVFFTFIALFIIILIIAIVSTKQRFRYTQKSNAIASRIRTMNNFIDDYEKDIEREIYIGGYRALISMNSYIRQLQDYVIDFDTIFNEILVNGTANGTAMELMTQESQGASINSWLIRVNEEAGNLNIEINVDVHDVRVEHISPFVVRVKANLTSEIVDSKGLAEWTINKVYFKDFSIIGFEDPLYTVETTDKITVLINVTPSMDFVNEATNDTGVLQNHVENNFYINDSKGPSFLMRYTGNLSASEFGIVSFVNPEDLSAQLGSYKSRSLVDYVYFANHTTTDYCNFQNMSNWFRLDQDNLETYEVDGIDKTSC
ncbi:hypothetical protein HN789_05230 [archaeon]|jgi:hypothetical protein|nr:hypothetical protein [archaeon]MBT4022914.1 hypothetical protein [archaeon]MBT4272561.1 hypothetical protein [archaeon]MBT4460371.1 hypothetical protein [archaeon]MBT4859002.1 hypothetical protein [archaeon]